MQVQRTPQRMSVWARIAIWLGLFVVAFLLRTTQLGLPGSALWIARSQSFLQAVETRHWEETFQSRHPGVMTMAVGAASLWLHDQPFTHNLIDLGIPPDANQARTTQLVITYGQALVMSLLLVAIGLALQRMGGWLMGVVGFVLLAFSPYYLSLSRIIHVDAVMSTLMLLSAVLLLLSKEVNQKRYFILSGLVGGLAFLAKVPSVFMIPFCGLTLLVYALKSVWLQWKSVGGARIVWLLKEVWGQVVGPLLGWVVLAILPTTLWPVMWVKPAATLDIVVSLVRHRVENTPDSPHFFAGTIYEGVNLGVGSYATYLLFLTTGVTLTLCIAALLIYALWRKRIHPRVSGIAVFLMATYIVFFTIQMSLGGRQAVRYILPAVIMADVLAVIGLAALIDLVQRELLQNSRWVKASAWSLAAMALALQMGEALAYAPEYGAHHNALLGGNRAASQMMEVANFDEGAILALDYLSHRPDAQQLEVATRVDYLDFVFPGKGARLAQKTQADYYLFGVDDLQRQNNYGRWGLLWEGLQGTKPELLVEFDGVPFVYLFKHNPDANVEPIIIRKGGLILIALAWAWALMLGVLIFMAVRRPHAVMSETAALLPHPDLPAASPAE